MQSSHIVEKLQTLYPGKAIIGLPEQKPVEIICEIEPTSDHLDYSIAISVVGRSAAHYHLFSTEIYEVLIGTLTVFIDGEAHILEKGDKITIEPGAIHYVTGEEAWFRVQSRPGWTEDDHFLVS
jgi:mannose-6-phosphate isomerase-like protein (cupin superfamily)